MNAAKTYSRDASLDLLKGLAIIAVVLFHAGVTPRGYLGVDAFFCLNGYFITRVITRRLADGSLGYLSFLRDRVVRLWPVLIAVSAAALIAGYYLMLPDDYENLGHSVIASNLFANNILANVTTRDYWAVRNMYQPLMHTWYLGVLVQCYLVFPVIVYCCLRLRRRRVGMWLMIGLFALSLYCSVSPDYPASERFYFVQYRAFEFLGGAIVALYAPRMSLGVNSRLLYWAFVAAIVACFLGLWPIPGYLMAATVVILTAATLWLCADRQGVATGRVTAALAWVGTMSLSIYLWHQAVIAFYRYCFSDTTEFKDIAVIFLLTAALSVASYIAIERQVARVGSSRGRNWLFAACLAAGMALCGIGLAIHRSSGVVRDIPELGVNRGQPHSHLHSEYNERIYRYMNQFTADSTAKVLVVGNSFARDFANVLLESRYASELDISYRPYHDLDSEMLALVGRADVIFVEDLAKYEWLRENTEGIRRAEIYLIGCKNFGMSNGMIYRRRGGADYWTQTQRPDNMALAIYRRERQSCDPDRYIDMLAPALNADSTVRVFTPDSMFISQDCLHLTPSGARHYARHLSPRLNSILQPACANSCSSNL